MTRLKYRLAKSGADNIAKLFKNFYGGAFSVEEMSENELEELLKTQRN